MAAPSPVRTKRGRSRPARVPISDIRQIGRDVSTAEGTNSYRSATITPPESVTVAHAALTAISSALLEASESMRKHERGQLVGRFVNATLLTVAAPS
jgi:hypothetical protein